MKNKVTITPILYSRISSDGKQFVKIRVTQFRKSTFVNLGIKVKSSEWNERLQRVKSNCKDYIRFNEIIESELERLHLLNNVKTDNVLTQMNVLYTPIIDILNKRHTLSKENPDQYSSEKKVKSAINHLISSGFSNVKLCEFTPEMVVKFDNYLRRKNHLQPASIFSYHRVIRATINKFCKIHKISRSVWEDPYSLKVIEMNRKSNPKYALLGFEIHQLEEYLIFHKRKGSLEFTSLSMFLFSYYSFGMRYGDVFKIHWKNFKYGKLEMKSEKTEHPLTPMKMNHKQTNIIKYFSPVREFYLTGSLSPKVKTEVMEYFPELDKLLSLEEKYMSLRIKHTPIPLDEVAPELFNGIQVDLTLDPSEDEKEEMEAVIRDRDEILMSFILKCCYYLKTPIFPFYPSTENDKRKVIHRKESSNVIVNRELKKTCLKFKFRVVSFHYARHSFAHNARLSKIFDIYQISRALNHSGLDITTTYLNSFEDGELDEANDRWTKENMNSYYPI
jgi:hypothetical protein